MGLEIRKRKDGTLIQHWYGAYRDHTGRRVIESLSEPLPRNMPASLLEKGDPDFEASRARAEKELADFKTEARAKGRADNLTERLIESKTGRKWTETPLADLPGVVQTMKGKRSKNWRRWQVDVIGRFADWAGAQGLRSVLEITPEIAESYIETLSEPDEAGRAKTPSTIRHVKNIIGFTLGRVLPGGVENPFKNIRILTPEGGETAHRKPLNPFEVEKLLTEAKADPFVYPLIVTALSTGLRRGDVCRLKWSSVNLKTGALTVKTSKTGAAVTLPIMETLRAVLECALAEWKVGAVYVFPNAQLLLDGKINPNYIEDDNDTPQEKRKKMYLILPNPDAITYRVKKVFATAFALPQDAPQADADAPERVTLADVLPDVLEAVRAAKMSTAKRDKLTDLLTLYASGKSYREIQAGRTISRGGISGLLHEAEELAGVRFLPDTGTSGDSIKKSIKDITRKSRAVGMRDASKYDFHGLRTSFVTLAITAGFPLEKIKALTGHRTVEMAMKHYFKPEGADFKNELEAAMPQSLTGRKGARLALKEADPVATISAQLKALTKRQRAQLMQQLKKGEIQ